MTTPGIGACDARKEEKSRGKASMGAARTTCTIDENGVIGRAFGAVRAAENPARMLAAPD